MNELRSWEFGTQRAMEMWNEAIRRNPDVARERDSSERYEMQLRYEMDQVLERDETKWIKISF